MLGGTIQSIKKLAQLNQEQSKKIQILIDLLGQELFDKYTQGSIKGLVQSELCSLQEFLFRYYNKSKKNNKLWFFDYENAMLSKKELKI